MRERDGKVGERVYPNNGKFLNGIGIWCLRQMALLSLVAKTKYAHRSRDPF